MNEILGGVKGFGGGALDDSDAMAGAMRDGHRKGASRYRLLWGVVDDRGE